MSDANGYPYCNVYDANGEILVEAAGENNMDFRAQVLLEEGQTVTLELSMLGEGVYDVYASKPVAATSVELVIYEYMVLSGSGDTVYVFPDFYISPMVYFPGAPNTFMETCELTANSENTEPDEEGFYYLEAGQSVTFTVTTESGLTDTITVVAIDILVGDFNLDGRVGLADAMCLFYTVNGILEPDNAALGAMELTGDNEVSSADALRMFYYVNGTIDAL